MNHKNEACYLVYKHTNTINGKTYVGQTCQKQNERWGKDGKRYECYWIDENGVKHPSHFWSAIQKYGWNNFEHKVLIHGLTKSQADFWEKKLIKEWDLMNSEKGYNKREGGSNGELSDETKHKISVKAKERLKIPENNPMYGVHRYGEEASFFGKKHTYESKQKMSETRKRKITSGEIEVRRGFKCSNETKQKLSKTKKEKYANGEIKSWNKGKKLPQFSGENHPFYDKHHTEESKQKLSETRKRKIASGEIEVRRGFKLSEESKQKMRENHADVSGVNNPRATKVIRLSDGKIYNLIQECAKDNQKSRGTIRTHCKNRNKNGLQEFMYYDEFLDIKGEMC